MKKQIIIVWCGLLLGVSAQVCGMMLSDVETRIQDAQVHLQALRRQESDLLTRSKERVDLIEWDLSQRVAGRVGFEGDEATNFRREVEEIRVRLQRLIEQIQSVNSEIVALQGQRTPSSAISQQERVRQARLQALKRSSTQQREQERLITERQKAAARQQEIQRRERAKRAAEAAEARAAGASPPAAPARRWSPSQKAGIGVVGATAAALAALGALYKGLKWYQRKSIRRVIDKHDLSLTDFSLIQRGAMAVAFKASPGSLKTLSSLSQKSEFASDKVPAEKMWSILAEIFYKKSPTAEQIQELKERVG